MNTNSTAKILLSSILIAAMISDCSNKKSKNPAPAATPVPSWVSSGPVGPAVTTPTGMGVIREMNNPGTTLYANIGQQSTWSFVIDGGSGTTGSMSTGMGTINSITSSNPKVIVSGSTASFNPALASDITGTLTVTGTMPGQAQQTATFMITSNGASTGLGGGILGGILGGLLGGGAGGGIIGSLLKGLLQKLLGGSVGVGAVVPNQPGTP